MIQSMTGYGKAVVAYKDKKIHVEVKSLNSKQLDLNTRIAPLYREKEMEMRQMVAEALIRGKVDMSVWAEKDTVHPLQAFADLITIEEHKTVARPKVVLTWAPHCRALPQAVPNSFAQWMNAADVDLVITHPEGYELDPKFVGNARVEYDQKKSTRRSRKSAPKAEAAAPAEAPAKEEAKAEAPAEEAPAAEAPAAEEAAPAEEAKAE